MRSTPKDVHLKALQVKENSAGKDRVIPDVGKSSKHFFKKDYPFDKRPVADPFHFKHPYPVVQDGGEYDKDFVKDENSDNGSWMAQEEYDRLRVKLRKEKKELAEAMRRKGMREEEMKDALSKHDKGVKQRADAAAKVDRLKREEAERRRREQEQQPVPLPIPVPGQKKTRSVADDSDADSEDVRVSTEETEKAMKNLEDCKRQLAEARERLKQLMKELEDAKTAQSKANEVLDSDLKKELSEKEHHSVLKKEVNKEYKEYIAAKEAYERQKVDIGKLEIQIKAAAAKVKAMRDAADDSGGVYNTPEQKPHKAGAPAAHWLWALPVLVVFWMASA